MCDAHKLLLKLNLRSTRSKINLNNSCIIYNYTENYNYIEKNYEECQSFVLFY